MSNVPGKPGLYFIMSGFILNIVNSINQALITFLLGSTAMALTIIYYAIQIWKSFKHKK